MSDLKTPSAGKTFFDGYSAILDVHRASKKHMTAKDNLAKLRNHIKEQQDELARREEVERTYNDLVPSLETDIRATTDKLTEIAAHISTLQEEHEDLSSRLEEMRKKHEHELRPYHDLMESAQSRAHDTQKLLSEAKRAVKNAENQLNSLTERRDARITTLNRSTQRAKVRLEELRKSLTTTQADQSAKPGATDELEAAIATEHEHLRETQGKIDAVTQEMKRSIESAQTHLWTQRQSAEEAERANEAARSEAQIRCEDYEKMYQDAEAEENVLSSAISERESEINTANKKYDQYQRQLDETQAQLDDAHNIHATPEITEKLRVSIADAQGTLTEKQSEVDALAHAEQSLRERTRPQRRLFISIVIAVLILIAVLVWMVMFN